MSYTAHHKNLAAYVGDPPRGNVAVNGVGILRRAFGALLNAMEKSRQKQTEREIANFVASRGGRLTDDLEREMMRRTGALAKDSRSRPRCIRSLVMAVFECRHRVGCSLEGLTLCANSRSRSLPRP